MQDAEDIVQDIFVKMINHEDLTNINNLESYVRRSVRNASLKKIQITRRLVSLEEKNIDDSHFNISDEKVIIEREERIFINKQIEKLPPNCRKVFLMCVLDGMKYKEVATLQNVSVNTIKTQVKKAYKLLRMSVSEIYLFLNFTKRIKI